LDGVLHSFEVNTTSEPEVFVKKIPMTVLFGDPVAGPLGIRVHGAAGFIANAIKGVEHGHVGGQGLLSNHVTDQANEKFVREFSSTGSEISNAIQKILRFRGREVVCWLPQLVDWSQQWEDALGKVVLEGVYALQGILRSGMQDCFGVQEDGPSC